MQSEKNLYQADVQTVSLIKDMRENVHNICKEHVEKKVRIEAIDGQIFEGVIVDFDDQNVYVEVDDPDAEEDDYEFEEVASRKSHGDWGMYPDWTPYGYPYGGYQPFGDVSPLGSSSQPNRPPAGQVSPYADDCYPYAPISPFGSPNQPYGQVSPFGSPNQPFGQVSPFGSPGQPYGQVSPFGSPGQPYGQVSPFGSPGQPYGQVSPFGSPSFPYGQVSPFGEGAPFVSPYSGFNPYMAPFPPFPPYPPQPCYPYPPPPPPPAAVVVPRKKRRRPCRRGKRIIPLALFTLLTIALL
ncbi:hypothetical protein P9302_10665 [Brevibacillus agri]|uniref:hypothetical protein n=1 Tax=Brevibacillus agri TaxID=51101 RepID=UPI00046E8855|nr:hypothetical protein [Brevibacillus agri]MED4569938.1 hypothetical protein [Brevibacillus agri]WHX31613.1 hypothetical protein QNK09_05090 [Brevibacillus agri]